jgi:aminoglycoside 6'-N-acetyltransferase
MSTITLRKATAEDIPLLRYWDQQPHKKEADPNSDWQWETEIPKDAPWRHQLIAEVDGRPLGYVEILHCADDPEQYWGDVPDSWMAIDIWIGEAGDIGRGMGTHMLQLALAKCFQNANIDTVVLDPLASNGRARRFYEKNGFRFVEERWFGNDCTAVYKIERSEWNQA